MLFVFVSCIDDELTGGTASSSDKTELYMSFKIFQTSDWSQTRAATRGDEENDEAKIFSSGSEQEHKVGTEGNFVIFFKEDKTLHSIELIELAVGHKDNPDHEPATDPTDYIEAGYRTKFYATEDNMPKWCLLVLNGKQIYYELKDWELDVAAGKPGKEPLTMENVMKHVWDESAADKDPKKIGFNEKGLFTMTNSAYVENGKVYTAAEIKDENISHMPPEIDEQSVPLHIHVERMVAKCTFELTDGLDYDSGEYPDEDSDGEAPIRTIIKPKGASPLVFFAGINTEGAIDFVDVRDWRIKITGWGINALETKGYLFKNINNNDYFGNWNATDKYRSYWSEDPHYDFIERNDHTSGSLAYPWQYRWAIDKPNIEYYSDPDLLSDHHNYNYLRNYSYYDFKFENHEEKDGGKYKVPSFNFNEPVYVAENTYDKTVVEKDHDSRDELLAGTHLLIGAELEVYGTKEDGNRGFRIYDLYRDRNGIYYESERECFASLVHSFNQLLTSQSVMEFVLYDWDEGGRVSEKEIKNDNGKTEIVKWDTLVAKTGGNFMLCYQYPGESDYTVLDEKQLVRIIGENTARKYSEFVDKELLEQDSINFVNNFGSMVSAQLRSGDGKRLPWFEDAIEHERLAIKMVTKNGDGTYTINRAGKLSIHRKIKNQYGATVTEETALWDNADKNDIKSILYEWLGAINHFSNGKMYYAAGIDNTPEFDYKLDKYYGVVRNSWYQFRLKKLSSIGVPVDDPTQPIVPDRVSNNDQINVSIYILPWHHVEGSAGVFIW